jgi:hypothetical protein
MNFDRRGNFRGASILMAQQLYQARKFQVRLSSIVYYLAHEFCICAGVFRSKFQPEFQASVTIFMRCRNFMLFKYFKGILIFVILLDIVLQIFVYIFSIYLCIVYAPIFLVQLFSTLGLRLML